jgi:hypothetical protein
VARLASHLGRQLLRATLRMPPAMAASVSSRPWEIADIVALVEAGEAKPASAGRTRSGSRDEVIE